MKIVIGALALALGVSLAGVAYAGSGDPYTPQVLGHGGPTVVLKPNCSRQPVQLPSGRDWKIGARRFVLFGFNIYQQQIHCLVHRVAKVKGKPGPAGPPGPPGQQGPPGAPGVSKSDACWAAAGEVPTSSGIALRNYIDQLQDCIAGPDPAG